MAQQHSIPAKTQARQVAWRKSIYTELPDPEHLPLLQEAAGLPALEDCYLARRAALFLKLELRITYDFDFFTQHRFNAKAVAESIYALRPFSRIIHLDAELVIC